MIGEAVLVDGFSGGGLGQMRVGKREGIMIVAKERGGDEHFEGRMVRIEGVVGGMVGLRLRGHSL